MRGCIMKKRVGVKEEERMNKRKEGTKRTTR